MTFRSDARLRAFEPVRAQEQRAARLLFAAGKRPKSFDKDFIRAWVVERCDPYKDPIPEIPEDLILQTSDVYLQAYKMITGKPFVRDILLK